MKKNWLIPAILFLAACGQGNKEVSPLTPPSDEAVVEEEEKGFFESSKKATPEETERQFKSDFDADGIYFLTEPLTIGKYNINKLSLDKSEGATLTVEIEETADMIDLNSRKFSATQDAFSVQFSHRELGTIVITGQFKTNPWGEGVEENETVVLTGTIKSGAEAAKPVEFTWSSF